MKHIRYIGILLGLCLLCGCGDRPDAAAVKDQPSVHVTYTPDPTTLPVKLIEITGSPTPRGEEPIVGKQLYSNSWGTFYQGYRDERPGLCVETKDWSDTYTSYLELPGTEGLSKLTIPKIEVRPEGQRPGVYVLVYYLDAEGQERILCFDRNSEYYTLAYPLSTDPALALSEQQAQYYDDLLLIGYLYERIQGEQDRLSDPESWESLCQRRILDALYYNYKDALPPYLAGEGAYGSDHQHAAIVSLKELELFFQITLGRPCLAQIDFDKEDRKYCPDLPEDQIVIYPSDFYFSPHVKQAVQEKDGAVTLYGYVSGFEMRYCDVICRIRPVEGFLGGQLVSAEIFPAQIIDSAQPTPEPDPVKAAALLYTGENSIFYRGYRDGRPGICVEQLLWRAGQNMLYQELPGTEGLSELTVTGIEAKPEGQLSKAYVYVRYLDNEGQERTVCFDHYGGDAGECYPLSAEPGLELTEEEQSVFNDLLLIGYLYEDFRRDKDSLSDPEHWEARCQQFILDSLYESHEEALPPYLTGEGIYDDEWQDTAILSQTELEAFFQSVLGRPNQVPDRLHYDEDLWPNLQPGQVPLPPTDTFDYAEVKQAVPESDGTVCLYGFASYGEQFYSAILVCRVRPTEGFLGWRIESVEMCPVTAVTADSAITFVP